MDGSSDFLPSISQVWNQWIIGSPIYIWEQKLKLVKGLLKTWAKTSSIPIQNKVKEKKLQLEKIQGEMETKEVQQSHITSEQKIHKEYIQALNEEEIIWRLKSRSLWLKAGDQNTSFFHRQSKARLWSNQISEIKTPEGEIIKEFDQIKQQTSTIFSSSTPQIEDQRKPSLTLFSAISQEKFWMKTILNSTDKLKKQKS
jgi:hypothetical protein